MRDVCIYISDISNYTDIVSCIRPMLKKGFDVFLEKRPTQSMSGGFTYSYYLHIFKKNNN